MEHCGHDLLILLPAGSHVLVTELERFASFVLGTFGDFRGLNS
jgi:hypothetical protein